MVQKLLKGISIIENNPVLSSIRKGFLWLFPILMVGSMALLLQSFPIPAFQTWVDGALGGWLMKFLDYVYNATFGFMSAYLVLCVSFCYSETFREKNLSLQVMGMVVSLACFIASFGAASGALQLAHFGPTGVLTALLSSILATKLFFLLCRRLLRSYRTDAMGADIDYRSAASAIAPMLLCVMLFVGANLIISRLFHVDNINDLISNAIVTLFAEMNGGLGSGILFTLVLNLLWVFGVHGGNALEPINQEVLIPANTVPDEIISKSFLDNFAQIGGCGATVCLILAMLLFAKSKNNRGLARSSVPVALFNINELLVFGYPIIFNPMMLVPFVLVPVWSLLVAYTATKLGFLPIVRQTVTWTTPVLFSGYIATGSVNGILVQLFTIVTGTAMYAPFVRLSEKVERMKEELNFERLTNEFRTQEAAGTAGSFLERHDPPGRAAKSIIYQLRSDIASKNIPVFYQPQMDENVRIAGVEALLRWQYQGRAVYPPLLIALAREDGILEDLTACILERVCMDAKRFLSAAPSGMFQVSANIVAQQLGSTAFVKRCINMVESAGVCGHICLEVTEETSISCFEDISSNIERLKRHGVSMAIDDFSMGHTSLKYLQGNSFRVVKLDGSLVRQVAENGRCREIISSIIALGDSLNFIVVAEYVETQRIRDALYELGCRYYQGYLYSPAVPPDELLSMLNKKENNA